MLELTAMVSKNREKLMELVLSLFPGIDILGRGFEAEGFCVVRGPDLIWGQSIESFRALPGRFNGLICGSPCQNFTTINRNRDKAKGEWALNQIRRRITEAMPDWWLIENVPAVPDFKIDGYSWQRIDLRASECGARQVRLRHFQFGSRTGLVITVDRANPGVGNDRALTAPAALASEGRRKDRRTWADFCELQGLPREFDLKGWPVAFKYAAVGNAVHLGVARAIAQAIVNGRLLSIGAESLAPYCVCSCGRLVQGRQAHATAGCRKRMQLRRDSATAAAPGQLTAQ